MYAFYTFIDQCQWTDTYEYFRRPLQQKGNGLYSTTAGDYDCFYG